MKDRWKKAGVQRDKGSKNIDHCRYNPHCMCTCHRCPWYMHNRFDPPWPAWHIRSIGPWSSGWSHHNDKHLCRTHIQDRIDNPRPGIAFQWLVSLPPSWCCRTRTWVHNCILPSRYNRSPPISRIWMLCLPLSCRLISWLIDSCSCFCPCSLFSC